MRTMAPAAAKSLSHISPPVTSKEPEVLSASSTPCNPQSCTRLWPDSNPHDFEANAAVLIILLFSFLVCAMSLGAAIRCFLRGEGNEPPNRFSQTQEEVEKRKPSSEIVLTPTLAYSAGLKIAGAERDCTICLSEFVEGEEIYLLGLCNHGFHVQCIQQWLSSHSSCPVCRSSILSSSPFLEQASGSCMSSNSTPVLPAGNP